MEHVDKDTLKWIFRDHWDAFKTAPSEMRAETAAISFLHKSCIFIDLAPFFACIRRRGAVE